MKPILIGSAELSKATHSQARFHAALTSLLCICSLQVQNRFHSVVSCVHEVSKYTRMYHSVLYCVLKVSKYTRLFSRCNQFCLWISKWITLLTVPSCEIAVSQYIRLFSLSSVLCTCSIQVHKAVFTLQSVLSCVLAVSQYTRLQSNNVFEQQYTWFKSITDPLSH